MSKVEIDSYLGIAGVRKGDDVVTIGPGSVFGRPGAPDLSIMLDNGEGERVYLTISFEDFRKALFEAGEQKELIFE